GSKKPELRAVYSDEDDGHPQIEGTEAFHGRIRIWVDGAKELLFTDNETNTQALYGVPNKISYVKDAFHSYVVEGKRASVSPARAGTKAAARFTLTLEPGESRVVRARFAIGDEAPTGRNAFVDFEDVFAQRKRECDELYEAITPQGVGEEESSIFRQSLAGL